MCPEAWGGSFTLLFTLLMCALQLRFYSLHMHTHSQTHHMLKNSLSCKKRIRHNHTHNQTHYMLKNSLSCNKIIRYNHTHNQITTHAEELFLSENKQIYPQPIYRTHVSVNRTATIFLKNFWNPNKSSKKDHSRLQFLFPFFHFL